MGEASELLRDFDLQYPSHHERAGACISIAKRFLELGLQAAKLESELRQIRNDSVSAAFVEVTDPHCSNNPENSLTVAPVCLPPQRAAWTTPNWLPWPFSVATSVVVSVLAFFFGGR
jgi:hypothetical protein